MLAFLLELKVVRVNAHASTFPGIKGRGAVLRVSIFRPVRLFLPEAQSVKGSSASLRGAAGKIVRAAPANQALALACAARACQHCAVRARQCYRRAAVSGGDHHDRAVSVPVACLSDSVWFVPELIPELKLSPPGIEC